MIPNLDSRVQRRSAGAGPVAPLESMVYTQRACGRFNKVARLVLDTFPAGPLHAGSYSQQLDIRKWSRSRVPDGRHLHLNGRLIPTRNNPMGQLIRDQRAANIMNGVPVVLKTGRSRV